LGGIEKEPPLKRLLTFIFLSVLLTSCRAERITPTPDSVSPSADTPTPQSPADSATPVPSATSTVAPTPTPTSTPAPPVLTWCADGVVTCFDENYTFPLVRPIPIRIDQTYRYAGTLGGQFQVHHGVEFLSPFGTSVQTAGAGQVIFAGDDLAEPAALLPNFYGNYVVIKHDIPGHPVYSLYAHLSEINVFVGQIVSAGEKIGEVGMTGSATGSHLHFEIREKENTYFSTRNPELWYAPLEGMGALAGRIYDPNGWHPGGAIQIEYMENDQPSTNLYFAPLDIYPPELVVENGENFALNDLHPGQYRLTYIYNFKFYEYFVEIRPGILTLITIVLD
jgi:murein DD-endopeptidase MepM/ murein hydrolase activator NlpD